MATLRQVLNHFEQQSGAVSLTAMARELNMELPMLHEMINYWVRKGRLRQVNDDACALSCSTNSNCAKGCPFVFVMPSAYELVPLEAIAEPKCPRCH